MSNVDVHMSGKADIWMSGGDDWTILNICDDYTKLVFRVLIYRTDRFAALDMLLAALREVEVPDLQMDGQTLSWRQASSGIRVNTQPSENGGFVAKKMVSTSWVELSPSVTLFTSSLTEVRIHLGDMGVLECQ